MIGPDREFDYRPRWTTIIFCGLFFTVCSVVLGFKAANTRQGMIIVGLLELGPTGAAIFYWSLTACSIAFVVLAAFLAYRRLTLRQRIVLGATGLTVPKSGSSNEEKLIEYKDILDLAQTSVGAEKFLNVNYIGGKHMITASLLPSKAAFKEVCEILTAKVEEANALSQRKIADTNNESVVG